MTWGWTLAWPGCEDTAPLAVAGLPERSDAVLSADEEAAMLRDDGYLVVEVEDGVWAIAKPEAPDRLEGRIIVREERVRGGA